ncbi:hypothetical protein VTO73DRAFT_8583 [Trametes versicolor]
MWLLSTESLKLVKFNSLEEVLQTPCPWAKKRGYAILSHVWRRDKPEQSFADIERLCREPGGVSSYDDDRVDAKVRGCVRAAREQGFGWIWNDTCCIDTRSSAELEEAINSMYRWYAEAAMCLTYLQDVPDDCPIEDANSAFRRSRWFKRGWTLQELLAPHCLVFLSVNWKHLGTKFGLADLLQDITGIDAEVLTFHRALQHVGVARRMSWASKRVTSRIEDQAYSLLGIFNVSMATIYGEGEYAFRRLQVKIMKRTSDHTLFAWGDAWPSIHTGSFVQPPIVHDGARKSHPSSPLHRTAPPRFMPPSFEHSKSLFAPSPAEFEHAAMSHISLPEAMEQAREFFNIVIPPASTPQTVHEHQVTSSGVRCQFIIVPGSPFSLALLLCKDISGRCVALPLWPQRDDAHQLFRAGMSLSNLTYKYIPICSSNVKMLRNLGWVPRTQNAGNASSYPSSADSGRLGSHSRSALETPTAALPSATIQPVYITNAHPALPRGPRRSPQLTHEPRLLYIPGWLAGYLSLYELELANSPPLDEPVEAPSTLQIVRQLGPTPKTLEFVILFNSCGGRLIAHVDFPADGRARSYAEAAQGSQRRPNPNWPSTAPRHGASSLPPLCRATNALGPHAHINSWENGSRSFVDGKKEIRLSATPWPTPDSYCLEIRLGGEYFASLRKPQAQPEHRPMRAPQMSLPPSPPVSNAETTTTSGADSEGSPARHSNKRRGRNAMLSIPSELLFQPLAPPVPAHESIHAWGADVPPSEENVADFTCEGLSSPDSIPLASAAEAYY